MNNIFIDGGTHFGQGLNHFVNRFGMNDSWKIITFEANPITYELHSKNRKYNFVDYKNQAIYIFDGEITFNIETPPNEDDTGMGSSLISLDKWNPWGGELRKNFKKTANVSCIDFSNFIKNHFSLNDNIVCKLDIEGSEFEVLEKMILDDTLKYIKTLSVEFHANFFTNPDEMKEREKKIKSEIVKNNINYIEWH